MCTRISYLPKGHNPVLLGASYLAILRSPDNQTLWIFGEFPDINSNINSNIKPNIGSNIPSESKDNIRLIDYILSLINNRYKFYDIFLELEYNFTSMIGTFESFDPNNSNVKLKAVDISNYFKMNNWPNARVNYTDIRNVIEIYLDKNMQDISKILTGISSGISSGVLPSNLKDRLETVHSVIGRYFGKQDDTISLFDLQSNNRTELAITQADVKYDPTKLINLYNNIKNNVLGSTVAIQQFLRNIEIYIERYLMNNPEPFNKQALSALYQSFNNLYVYIKLYDNIMVIYALAIILHKFIGVNNRPINIENGIFYGDINHAKLITNFLIEMGYNRLFVSESISGYISVPKSSTYN